MTPDPEAAPPPTIIPPTLLTPTPIAIDQTALHAASNDELRARLATALEMTAQHLTYLAAVWRELESRGQDLSQLRGGLWGYMGLIAAGRLRAELVVRYAGHSMLLRRLAGLRPDEQERLLADDTVTIVEAQDGAFIERQIPITHLKSAQIAQVIGDYVRPPAEQRRTALTLSRRAPTGRLARPETEIVDIARAMPRRFAADTLKNLVLRLSIDEIAALGDRAKAAGVSTPTLVRAALIKAGLLESST